MSDEKPLAVQDHDHLVPGAMNETSACADLSPDTQGKRLTKGILSHRQIFPGFPYEPYDIQRRFMESMYATLDTGGVGLFESPTGAFRRQVWLVQLSSIVT